MKPTLCVGGIALSEGSILLIKRGQEPNKGCWTIPGGRVEFGESLAQAVMREMKEETNLQVRVGPLVTLFDVVAESFHYVIADYLVTITGGDLKANSDATDAGWFSLSEIVEMTTTPGLMAVLEQALSLAKHETE